MTKQELLDLTHNIIYQLEDYQDMLRKFLQEETSDDGLSETECKIEDTDKAMEELYEWAEELNSAINEFGSEQQEDIYV